MEFREEVELLRKELEKRDFYEDIIFSNEVVMENVKEIVARWIFNLQEYRYIEVEKFKDLFNELDEIVFPITIKEYHGSRSLDIKFIDAQGNKFYMSKRNICEYRHMSKYIIGRRNSSLEPLVDREFHYQIYENGTIALVKTVAMKLNQDGTNNDVIVNFCYNHRENTTEASLWSLKKIKIKYPTMSDEFDKKVLKFFFDNELKWYYYDVYPILKGIVTEIPDERVSISIVAEIENEIVSEIYVEKGIVQKYTVTQIINEGEMHIIKKIFAKELRKFLAEKN